MGARIYSPTKTAMQSGNAKSGVWVVDFDPEQPRKIDPLMGYTSSADMKSQVKIRFHSKEDAIAYCERYNIPYTLHEPKSPNRKRISYSDNFRYDRSTPWTH